MSSVPATRENLAVSSLIAVGRGRIRGSGKAVLPVQSGEYVFKFYFEAQDTDKKVTVRISDTDSAAFTELVMYPNLNPVVVESAGSTLTATGISSIYYPDTGSAEIEFKLDLPDAPGVWTLDVEPENGAHFSIKKFAAERSQTFSSLVGSVTGEMLADDAVTAAKIADGAITTAQLDPTVLRRHVRHAAHSGLGASGTGAFADVAWAPTGAVDFRARLHLSSRVTPAANCIVFGRDAGLRIGVRVLTTGAVAAIESTTTLAQSAAGAITFDGRAYAIEVNVTAAATSISVNGSVVATGAVASTLSTGAGSHYIGSAAATGLQRWPGAIYDVQLIDNVTPANSRRYLLDEPSGNYADSSGNGGAAATRNGTVETVAVLSADGLGRAWQGVHAPEVLRKHVRHAAYSGLGATGLNAFGTVGWAPTGSVSLQLSFHAMTTIVPAVGVYCVARLVTGYANVYIDTNGAISLRNGTTQILGSASGVIGFAGQTYAIEVNVTQTTGSIVVNGAVVAAGSFASQSWSTTTGNYYVGGGTPTAARWPGAMWNVRFADLLTANNSRRYLLDEVLGDYADSSGNGGSAMQRYGWVDTCGVLSADGLGRVWTGRPELVYSGYSTGNLDTSGTSTLTFTEYADPTSSFASNVWTAPAAGVYTITVSATVAEIGGAAGTAELRVTRDGTTHRAQPFSLSANEPGMAVAIAADQGVSAGHIVAIQIAAAGGAQARVTNRSFTLRFYPT